MVFSQPAKRSLASRLAWRNSPRKAGSSASGCNLRSWSRSVIQPSPIGFVMSRASGGLASSSQRRGVTPLVLLPKRSGNISAKSGTTFVFSNSEWMAATPLVLWVPTIARWAMRTFRAGFSSIRLMRASAVLIAGMALAYLVEEAAIDLINDLQVPRDEQLEQLDRPFLQGLGKQRVIGVGKRPHGQVPGILPAQLPPDPEGFASTRRRPWPDGCR